MRRWSRSAAGVADAKVVELAPIQRPIDRFQRTIHIYAKRIRVEHRAERHRMRVTHVDQAGRGWVSRCSARAAHSTLPSTG